MALSVLSEPGRPPAGWRDKPQRKRSFARRLPSFASPLGSRTKFRIPSPGRGAVRFYGRHETTSRDGASFRSSVLTRAASGGAVAFEVVKSRARGRDVLENARSLDYSAESDGEGEGRARGGELSWDWKTDERLRRSCEAGAGLRIAVLVSGGVDSSVALRLLCNAGHSCTAFYLKIWFQEDFDNFWSACPWEEDLSFARAVCDEAGVELKVVHLTDAYWGKVVHQSISEIQAGRTPNPDMLCNSRIKFGEFLEHVRAEQFDRVASGHYARVKTVSCYGQDVTQLHLSPDEAKDQTYFLSQLSQHQLSQLIFPLGELRKVEVRRIAKSMGLSNKQRKDSQGICFLGKVKFREFIGRHLGEKEGCLLEAETGQRLGTHRGFWFYTIGQRQGIGLSNGPWFVVAKDVDHNVVFISRRYFSEKKRSSFTVGSFNWISGSPPSTLVDMRCKVRHGPHSYECSMKFETPDTKESNDIRSRGFANTGSSCNTAVVKLGQDDQGLSPGQYAAFYQADMCLGSGIILKALEDETASNVSVEALERAKACSGPEISKSWKEATTKRRRDLVANGAGGTPIPENTLSTDFKLPANEKVFETSIKHENRVLPSDAGTAKQGILHFLKLPRIFSWLRGTLMGQE